MTRLLLAAILLLWSASAEAALNAYLKVEGQTQGEIKGDVSAPGHEGSILVLGMSHGVVVPVDAASGLPTGKRQHKPFTVIKALDRSSPLLMQALATNERLTNVELRFQAPDQTKKKKSSVTRTFYTVKLIDAQVTSILNEMLDTGFPENQEQSEREQVTFVYRRIEWTHEADGTTATDDWVAK